MMSRMLMCLICLMCMTSKILMCVIFQQLDLLKRANYGIFLDSDAMYNVHIWTNWANPIEMMTSNNMIMWFSTLDIILCIGKFGSIIWIWQVLSDILNGLPEETGWKSGEIVEEPLSFFSSYDKALEVWYVR